VSPRNDVAEDATEAPEVPQTGTRPLFRPEAIEAHARGRGTDDEGLELREGQTAWTFRLLILSLVLAIGAGLTVKVDETARGPAHVAGQTAVVDLPVSSFLRLRQGQQVRLHDAKGTIVNISQQPFTKDGVTLVPVTVSFPEGDVHDGTATVRLSRKTLKDLLLRRGDNG
jgi:hypothetical protein